MSLDNFLKNVLTDVRIELTEEFDRNFERKAFFDKAWKGSKLVNKRGSLMARTNNLRRSIRSRQGSNDINWSSSLPYASIHNDGGQMVVTDKMKRFFWAMYYKASGAGKGKGERATRLTIEAEQWKALALQKTGAVMNIEKRQFIGDHPQVRTSVERIVDLNFKELDKQIYNQLKK